MVNAKIIHEVSVQEGYARWAAQYNQEDNALIIVEEQLTTPLLATIPVTRVLDLGAGTGRYALRLAAQGAQVTALDQSEAMLSIARQSATHAGLPIQFLQHKLDVTLPGALGGFDLVIAALVLCHVENLPHVAHEAYRLLCPGGHILVTDFHPVVIASGERTQFTHADNTYFLPTVQHTVAHYLTALQDAGFHIEAVQEALVRDTPPGLLPVDVINKDGDKPFCLVILASKPTNHS